MLDTLRQDLRHAARSLRRRPLVTAVAVLSLALGVGVNTAIFSVFDRILLQRLPVPAPEELVNLTTPGPRVGNVSTSNAGDVHTVFTYPLLRDLERIQTSFTAIGGFRSIAANLAFHGQTVSAQGLLVSGSYFQALQMRPALGRLLTSDDDRDGAADVVVLNHRYWTTRFDANPAVLNDTIVLNGVPMTIVGVAAPGFDGTSRMDYERFFVPLRIAPRVSRWRDSTSRRDWWIYVMARLKPGVSMAQAEAQINPPFSAIVREVDLPAQQNDLSGTARQTYAARRIVLEAGSQGHFGEIDEARTILGLLFAVTALVLLIACANVANLLLARAAERRAEIGVRLAIGASAFRVFRLMFAESTLLAGLGAAGALLVGSATTSAINTLLPADEALLLAYTPNRAVLIFTLALSAATALFFGLAPAIQAVRTRPSAAPATQARATGSRATARMRSLLAGSQLALATALLALAGLFVVSLTNLARTDLGVQRAGLSMFQIAPILNGYAPPRIMALYDQVENALVAVPGVVSVTGSSVRLLDGRSNATNMVVEDFTPGADANTNARFANVGTRYFSTLGIPLVAGREFTAADTPASRPVAIVNQAFVRKFGLGSRAVGARIGTTEGAPPDVEIVGVVADAAYNRARESPPPQYFRPYRQTLAPTLTFYVRTAPGLDPAAAMAAFPALVHRFDPNLPVDDVRTMDAQFDDNTTSERMLMTLSSSLALLATVLAAIGLYAVLAYSVSQRVREIGIRMALGAREADVRGMVLAQTSKIAMIAALIGLGLSIGLGRLGQSFFFGVTSLDLRTQASAAALMLAVAAVAGFLPARRAAAVDPVEALRAE